MFYCCPFPTRMQVPWAQWGPYWLPRNQKSIGWPPPPNPKLTTALRACYHPHPLERGPWSLGTQGLVIQAQGSCKTQLQVSLSALPLGPSVSICPLVLRPWLGLQLAHGSGHPDPAVSLASQELCLTHLGARSFWKQQATHSPWTGGKISSINNPSAQWRQCEPAHSGAPDPVGDTALAHTSSLAPLNHNVYGPIPVLLQLQGRRGVNTETRQKWNRLREGVSKHL